MLTPPRDPPPPPKLPRDPPPLKPPPKLPPREPPLKLLLPNELELREDDTERDPLKLELLLWVERPRHPEKLPLLEFPSRGVEAVARPDQPPWLRVPVAP